MQNARRQGGGGGGKERERARELSTSIGSKGMTRKAISMSGESCTFAGLMISNTAVYFVFAGSVHCPAWTQFGSTLSMISSFTPSAHSLK